MFAPDLSKIYRLYTSAFDDLDPHLKQRTAWNRISNIKIKGKQYSNNSLKSLNSHDEEKGFGSQMQETNMLIVWLMMWILCKHPYNMI